MIDSVVRQLTSPEETRLAAASLAADLKAGDVVALMGTLGAGKTHFTQGLVKGLGSVETVTSPTFGIVHEYVDGRLQVYHFDFYRLESAEELLEIGWDDYLERDGVVVVEWADRFRELLPKHAQWWRLEHEESGGRRLERLS